MDKILASMDNQKHFTVQDLYRLWDSLAIIYEDFRQVDQTVYEWIQLTRGN